MLALSAAAFSPSAGAQVLFGSATTFTTASQALDLLPAESAVVYAVSFGTHAASNIAVNTGSNIYNFQTGAGTPVTLSGVPGAVQTVGENVGLAGADFGNTNFNTAVGSFNWVGGGMIDILLTGLTDGQNYSVQLFAVDDRNLGGATSRGNQYSGDGGVTFSTTANQGNTINPGAVTTPNQYIIGTFRASGTTQTIRASAVGSADTIISALVLRAVAPELNAKAGLLPLTLFGFIGVLLWDRRRHKPFECC